MNTYYVESSEEGSGAESDGQIFYRSPHKLTFIRWARLTAPRSREATRVPTPRPQPRTISAPPPGWAAGADGRIVEVRRPGTESEPESGEI